MVSVDSDAKFVNSWRT